MIKTILQRGFTAPETLKLTAAIDLTNHIITSPEFKIRVLGFAQRNGRTQFTGSVPTLHVWQDLAFGDVELSFEIRSYPWWNIGKRKEVAHEDLLGPVFNRRFFSGQDIPSLSGTVAHELCHKLGYSHSFRPNADREFSVPYAIGAIVEALAKKLLAAANG